MAAVPPDYRAAIARWGHLADAEARKYNLTGAQLVAKIISGESGFRMNAVSSANARGAGQFIPSTRQLFIDRYGVDPWASVDSAVHAVALYMQHGGLAGYNPGGGQSYINYVLGQNVSGVPQAAGADAFAGTTTGDVATTGGGGLFDPVRDAAVKALLWIVLVAAGAWLTFRGAAKLAGVQPSGVNLRGATA